MSSIPSNSNIFSVEPGAPLCSSIAALLIAGAERIDLERLDFFPAQRGPVLYPY